MLKNSCNTKIFCPKKMRKLKRIQATRLLGFLFPHKFIARTQKSTGGRKCKFRINFKKYSLLLLIFVKSHFTPMWLNVVQKSAITREYVHYNIATQYKKFLRHFLKFLGKITALYTNCLLIFSQKITTFCLNFVK